MADRRSHEQGKTERRVSYDGRSPGHRRVALEQGNTQMSESVQTLERPGGGSQLDYEAIVIGAGVCGIYQLHRFLELGVSATVLEAGADLGGTWFWNRYPGARFDSESITYGYSFSEELLQEWDWKERFSGQPENLRYLNYVADKFDLRPHMQFGVTVEHAVFDDATTTWTLHLDDGRRADVPLPRAGDRPAVGADAAALRRDRRVPGAVVPHVQLADRAGGDDRQAGRCHRHRRHRRAADRRDRRQGGRAHRLPAPPELVRPAAQRRDHARRDGRHQGPLRRDLRHLRPHARWLHPRTGPPAVLRRPARGAPRQVGAALRRARLRDLAGQLPRHVHGRGGQRRALGVHRRQDPVPRPRPGRRREAGPQGPRVRRAARPDGDPVLRGLQPRQRAPRRPPGDADRAHHGARHPRRPRARSSSTSSCTRPGSTP